MISLQNILQTVCTLKTKEGDILTGYFYKPRLNLWFEYRSNCDIGKKYPNGIPTLCGNINGVDITVIDLKISSTYKNQSFTGQMSCEIVVFGLSTYDKIEVKQVSMDCPSLLRFSVKSPWVYDKNKTWYLSMQL
jgi:hypothetical protein